MLIRANSVYRSVNGTMNPRLTFIWRYRVIRLLLLLMVAGPATLLAQTEPPQVAKLRKLLDKLPNQKVEMGACIMRLSDGLILYERNADLPLIPASNQKLLTAAVAVERLGSDFAFETRLYRQGRDLLLVGGGDPALGDAKVAADNNSTALTVFENWAKYLRDQKLTFIEGQILIDDRWFESEWIHPTWEADDLNKWYAAPVGGLNFNDNCIEVALKPTQAGGLVEYTVFPPNGWTKIINQCKTGGNAKPWLHREKDGQSFSIRGQTREVVELGSAPVADPGLFTGEVLRESLIGAGISVVGGVQRWDPTQQPIQPGEEPTLLATNRTPISSVLRRALTDSQNLFAECLLKTLSRAPNAGSNPGSWTAGQQVIRQTLESWGIDVTGLVVVDGSGLSRDNRLTARQLLRVLQTVHGWGPKGDLLIRNLAVNGRSGTLRKRMTDIPDRVWGKTGYIRGVRTFSGYVIGADQQWYAVVILFNNLPGGSAPYNDIHDEVCRILARPG
ncbi:MAG: D-alanyl-D-alanine carboxypeptidase [Phycisphaerae bacterium]|nr:D-alanyl-D-alanine carboxypeptidase [Phycisphaerae bacterium]